MEAEGLAKIRLKVTMEIEVDTKESELSVKQLEQQVKHDIASGCIGVNGSYIWNGFKNLVVSGGK